MSNEYAEIAERFARDTAGHQMTVLRDDGLYRHLWFMNPRSSEYWFELVTWPGCLTMRGDIGDGYTFARLDDMFQFFRADRRWGINPHYWSEKLGGGRSSVREYSENLLRQRVVEQFVEDARWNGGVPPGTGKALRTWVLNEDLDDEHHARNVLEDFAHQGYEFSDVWEWDFHDYEPEYLWACHAIVWGIARYDRVHRYGLQSLAAPAAREAVDFFRSGRTYRSRQHADLRFQCLSLTVAPDSGERQAVGWRFGPPRKGVRRHRIAALDAADWACCDWTETSYTPGTNGGMPL